jgi:hypothetical protein
LSKDGSLAQSVEQLAVNQFVGGSSPSSPAKPQRKSAVFLFSS